jgi:heptosyltransferase-2
VAVARLVAAERAVRGSFVRAVAAAARHPGPLPRPDWSARPHRVLVLRPEGVGDLILTTGLLRAIRERHPTIVLDVLTVPNNAPVLAGNPHVRRVHLADPGARLAHYRWLPALRAERYDAVVDAMVAHRVVKTRTVVQLAALGARLRVGVGGRENDGLYTLPVAAPPPLPGEAEPHQVALIGSLGAAFDVAPGADLAPRLYLADAERRDAAARWAAAASGLPAGGPRVLLNISISPLRAPWRRWPAERYAALAAHLRRAHPDAGLVVLALPHERAAAEEIAALAGGVAPPASLREMFALVAAADLVFTPDTGVVHVASAFGTPAVVATLPESLTFAPYRIPGATLVGTGRSLATIELAPVVAAMDAELSRQRAEGVRRARTQRD